MKKVEKSRLGPKLNGARAYFFLLWTGFLSKTRWSLHRRERVHRHTLPNHKTVSENGAHSAKNTEAWWAAIHTRYGIRPLIDVGDPTIDGASNGKAGARLVFKLPTAALTPGRRQNQPRT